MLETAFSLNVGVCWLVCPDVAQHQWAGVRIHSRLELAICLPQVVGHTTQYAGSLWVWALSCKQMALRALDN